MQTKKKVSSKTSAREAGSPRRLKSQKKQPGHAGAAESKDANMITSSARKPKSAGVLAKQNGDAAADLNIQKRLLQDVTDDVASGLGSNASDIDASFTHKEHAEGTAHSESESIFSPNFHLSRTIGDSANGDIDGACLSSEVSTIYLTMKTSKLECLDECGQDSMSTDSCVDEEEQCEEFDDFDPYLFIKNLPELSKVVPTFRPLLLPKQTRRCPPTTLVLDLDETLVHSSLEPCEGSDFTFSVNFNQKEHTVYVRCRPHLQDFMERVAGRFEIIIFTASQSIYAEQLLNVLDPKRKVFRHRVYRESCVFVEGNYLKDLSILGRDLARVIIIDNSPQAFGFQVDNGIPIESWFEDRSDQELLLLLPFLDSLVGVEDVRPLIAQRYNLRQRIDAAAFPSSYPNKEDPFERS